MKRVSDSSWVVFALTLVGSGLAVVAVTVLLLSADHCTASVGFCNGAGKLSAEIMLALSVAWFLYLIFRFARDPDKF